MKKNLISKLSTAAFLIFNFLFAAAPVLAQTEAWEEGLCVQYGVATIQGIGCLLANVLSIVLTVIGIAGFIMMVVGSLRWLLSGGNTQNVESAKKTMTYAVIGLVVAISSFAIINLIAEFTGVHIIKEFFIPTSDFDWT